MALGKPNVAPEVAACYDCHGHHDVLPAFQPALPPVQGQHPGHLPQVPSQANASFTEYKPHANPLDARTTPLLHWTFVLHDRRC